MVVLPSVLFGDQPMGKNMGSTELWLQLPQRSGSPWSGQTHIRVWKTLQIGASPYGYGNDWNVKAEVLFARGRTRVPGWCQAGRSGMGWRGSSRTDFRRVPQQHSLTPRAARPPPASSSTRSYKVSPHSFPWNGFPRGLKGYRLLHFSLSILTIIIFISMCSHNNPGLCLTKLLVLNCMSSCMCLLLHLRWAVALRFGLPCEVFHSLNNMDAIQTPLKPIGILQLTHRPWSNTIWLNQIAVYIHKHIHIHSPEYMRLF